MLCYTYNKKRRTIAASNPLIEPTRKLKKAIFKLAAMTYKGLLKAHAANYSYTYPHTFTS